jgi:Bacterial transcriptional activator domain
VAELETLVAEDPLRERLDAQQMLALFAAGARLTRWPSTGAPGGS